MWIPGPRLGPTEHANPRGRLGVCEQGALELQAHEGNRDDGGKIP